MKTRQFTVAERRAHHIGLGCALSGGSWQALRTLGFFLNLTKAEKESFEKGFCKGLNFVIDIINDDLDEEAEEG